MSSRTVKAEDVIYRVLLENEGKVLYQNELCKKLSLNSKTVSKVLKKFEDQGIIKREKAYRSGKITYRITFLKRKEEIGGRAEIETVKPNLNLFLKIPCFTCLHIDYCYEGGYFEPKACPWIKKWIEDSVKE